MDHEISTAEMTSPSEGFHNSKPLLDVKTTCLLIAQWCGVGLAYFGHKIGFLPAPISILLGIMSMNLSFTIWHEGIHGTISRSRQVNDWLARLGAVPVAIPYSRLKVPAS
jgi:fatty acid desaturase